MRLTQLLAELDVLSVDGDVSPVRIRGVACHSTDISPGKLFVCIRGEKHDGHRFIDEAVARGAAAVVIDAGSSRSAPTLGANPTRGDTPTPGGSGPVPVIRVENTRQAYALLCAARAGHPSRKVHVTGITGTNGKTTTAMFLDAAARQAGCKTGIITTVFTRVGDDVRPQCLTTPEAGTLQSTLADMADAGVERVVLEASSHALAMHRTTGVTLQTAVFTNLTRDHLDYHQNRGDYLRAKARLFHLLDEERGTGVINVDDAAGRRLAEAFGRGRFDRGRLDRDWPDRSRFERSRFDRGGLDPEPFGGWSQFDDRGPLDPGRPHPGRLDRDPLGSLGSIVGDGIRIPRRVVTFGFHRPADVVGRLLPPGFGTSRPEAEPAFRLRVGNALRPVLGDAPGPGGEAVFRPERESALPPGTPRPTRFHLHIVTPTGAMTIPLPPPGPAHGMNALAAAAAAWSQGIPLAAIAQGLAAAPLPPGRFQEISYGQPFRVVVDFAHNPTGLAYALAAFRWELTGRLHLVFGCKGDDGDEVKRRLMGRIAARAADSVIVTTDNPFHECPRRIADAVVQGVGAAPFDGDLRVILDRAEAIEAALARARPGDGVLIAGRGHEQVQRFGDEIVSLDDADVASRWLQDRFVSAFV